MGLSWGIFTTEKVMSRVGCLICPGGVCKTNGGNWCPGWMCGFVLGASRLLDLSWGVCKTNGG